MVKGLRAVVGLKDPVGAKISRWIRPNGLVIQKVRVPDRRHRHHLRVAARTSPPTPPASASRPPTPSSCAAARRRCSSNLAIAEAMQAGGAKKGLPGARRSSSSTTTDRDAVRELVQLEGRVDLVIPRGGESLIRAVAEQARVPVIKHYKGVCHVYVDESAEPGHGAEDRRERQVPAARASATRSRSCWCTRRSPRAFLPRMAERLTRAQAWNCAATPRRARSFRP